MFVPLTPLEFERRAVKLYGEQIGVVDGERRFTYREFGERVSRLANALGNLGVCPGDRVAYLAYNCHQLLEGYYGVVAAGAVLQPLNIRLTPEELTYILNHSEAKVLFLDTDFLPLYQRMQPSLQTVRDVVLLEGELPTGFVGHSYEGLLAAAQPVRPDLAIDENAMAELFYTSGSTGTPKGVMMTHRNLYLHAMYCQAAFQFTDRSVLLHVVPLFHVNGWGAPHYLTMTGGRHVMLRKFDPATICRLIQNEKVTFFGGVPTMFNALLAFPDLDQYDLSSLQRVVIGGAPSSPLLIEAIEKRLKCEAFTGYGLTETCPVLTAATGKITLGEESDAARYRRQATTGLPVAGVELRVVDADGHDVPANNETIGEIVARSNVVMAGYYRDPEATAAVIVDGWFHTGDMAVVDPEGYVTIVDRKKDIIISGGENISSIEVETVLSAHPSVYECAVVAVPDPQWGEVPKAFVALKPGQSATTEDLITHCRAHLAGFKTPKTIEFRDSLPKGGTGKILKKDLREPYWQGSEKRVH
ncbi:MAG TPA: fatty acid--CoA ligase [Chloroflexota bacterium]|nr:fatty acid--CoA ligase [Chloroflexota bacterium]